MAQNPLVALLLAANLTTFDPTTITPNSSVPSKVMGVRVDIPQGRWWSAKSVDNITFPLLDVNSTVYVSTKSLTNARAIVNAPNITYNFLFGQLFSAIGAKMCSLDGISKFAFTAEFEQYYDEGPMSTSEIEGKSNVATGAISYLNPANLTDIVFRPRSGCFEFFGLMCNFDHVVNPPTLYNSLNVAFSRDEFSALNPSSGIDHCSEIHSNSAFFPLWENKDNRFNVAYKIPTKLWEHSTVHDDAALFYHFIVTNDTSSNNHTTNSTTNLTTTTSPVTTEKPQASAAHHLPAIIGVLFAMILSLLF